MKKVAKKVMVKKTTKVSKGGAKKGMSMMMKSLRPMKKA